MKKLNSRETFILILATGLIIFFVAYRLVIKPVQESSMDIDDRLRLTENKLMKARQMVSQKPVVEDRYKQLMVFIGTESAEEVQMPAIISKVESAARQSSIRIANIQPQKSIVQKDVGFMMIELDIDGKWLDLVQFFFALQQQPNYYFIKDLNLEKHPTIENTLRGRVVILRMYLISAPSGVFNNP